MSSVIASVATFSVMPHCCLTQLVEPLPRHCLTEAVCGVPKCRPGARVLPWRTLPAMFTMSESGKDMSTAEEVEDMINEAVNVAVNRTLGMVNGSVVFQLEGVMNARAALVAKGLLPATCSSHSLSVLLECDPKPGPQWVSQVPRAPQAAPQAPQEPQAHAASVPPMNPSGAHTPSLPVTSFPPGIYSLEQWGRTAITHGSTYNDRSYKDVFANAPSRYIDYIDKGIPKATPGFLDFQSYVKARRHQLTPEPMYLPGSTQLRRFVTSDQP